MEGKTFFQEIHHRIINNLITRAVVFHLRRLWGAARCSVYGRRHASQDAIHAAGIAR